MVDRTISPCTWSSSTERVRDVRSTSSSTGDGRPTCVEWYVPRPAARPPARRCPGRGTAGRVGRPSSRLSSSYAAAGPPARSQPRDADTVVRTDEVEPSARAPRRRGRASPRTGRPAARCTPTGRYGHGAGQHPRHRARRPAACTRWQTSMTARAARSGDHALADPDAGDPRARSRTGTSASATGGPTGRLGRGAGQATSCCGAGRVSCDSSLRCFFFAMRLRRFLMTEPTENLARTRIRTRTHAREGQPVPDSRRPAGSRGRPSPGTRNERPTRTAGSSPEWTSR